MIHARRPGPLSGPALAVLLMGSAGLLAPAAAPAAAVPAAAGAVLPSAPGASADLTDALTALAAEDPSPDRLMMRQAFVQAGFAEESVEVSLDVTPTGLAVDSIRGAAPRDGSCLFGEVREGQVAVTVLPVLGDGNCFIGDQR